MKYLVCFFIFFISSCANNKNNQVDWTYVGEKEIEEGAHYMGFEMINNHLFCKYIKKNGDYVYVNKDIGSKCAKK